MTEALATPRTGARVATPYMGLVPYGEEDADFFFGRSEEKQVVIGNLRGARLTILYGPSGVGKTSLLQAGVLHDLREQVRTNVAAGRAPFAICAFRAWREDPLPALVEAVHAASAEACGGEQLPTWSTGTPLVETLRAWTQQVRTLLVVLDEFQDYFLYHPDEHGERAFAKEFPELVNDPNLRVHFLLSLREDSLARLDRFTGRIPRLFANHLRVEHLDRRGGHEAIVRPLEQWNSSAEAGKEVTIEPALVEALLTQVETGKVLVEGAGTGVGTVAGADESRIEAPYLQLVLNRLWTEEQRARSRVLRLQTLERLGGARRIISTHLDTTMAAFPAGTRTSPPAPSSTWSPRRGRRSPTAWATWPTSPRFRARGSTPSSLGLPATRASCGTSARAPTRSTTTLSPARSSPGVLAGESASGAAASAGGPAATVWRRSSSRSSQQGSWSCSSMRVTRGRRRAPGSWRSGRARRWTATRRTVSLWRQGRSGPLPQSRHRTSYARASPGQTSALFCAATPPRSQLRRSAAMAGAS